MNVSGCVGRRWAEHAGIRGVEKGGCAEENEENGG